ncbi:TetR/AcrR family transcriptional regulator C-terminal domain-containing protein [Streptomyces sp. NBC_01334]|uniref:TetR/AcrR family transcriptional regulator C-terminal domain-containing protein n=1 Tax=Streptomyces sp. NBC_01334 TaxID=2903827 RepID=UPI002E101FEF|nr:TetR/AcrR family transcriptional regulator C-terminal domain-containing protein [Streptomyces sp. NBC_01334]
MADLFRIVIAELSRFLATGRVAVPPRKDVLLRSGTRCLDVERGAGTVVLDDPEPAAAQFLGMIADYVFRPRMPLPHRAPDDAAVRHVVDEAVLMTAARYATA